MRGSWNLNMFLLVKKFVLFILVLKQYFVCAQTIDDSQMNQYVSAFQKGLESHIDKVLAYKQIQQMLEKAEADLVYGPINGAELFSEIFQNVSLRYNDVVLAATSLKRELENSVSSLDFKGDMGPPLLNGGPPPLPLTKCCCDSGPGTFDGRLRDRVQNKACYGEQDALLKSISKTEFVNKLKQNYDTGSGITWQYFADSDGHYVQYPGSNRVCDKSAPPLLGSCNKLDSPLTKEWFVEKLHMEHKNLVILMDNSMKQDPSAPPVSQGVIVDAVVKVLGTLTPSDKVNIVAIPSSSPTAVEVPAGCGSGLFVVTETNLNKLKIFARQLTSTPGEPDVMAGLRKVYGLLESEKNENPESFKMRTNLVLILLNGKSKPAGLENTRIFEMIANYQQKLDNSAQHFVYTLGKPGDETVAGLAQVAHQNNLKLDKSSRIKAKPWPQIPNLVSNQSVGPEGVLVIVQNQSDFVSTVGRYFQRLPPQVDKELTTIVPVFDNKYGLGLTVAVPVYDGNQTFGVVAVDGSMATIFSEVVNFHTGTNSYMYIVDSTHGHVLLHPKLRDPSETRYKDTIFPRLELLEGDLGDGQRKNILTAGTGNVVTFETQVKDIHPEIDGELVTSRADNLSPATVYCQKIRGTNLIVVLVLFRTDVEEPKFHTLGKVSLHGIYHRLDQLYGAPGFPGHDSICHLENGHFLSFKQSVIKFSPSVFKQPEVYKYTDEAFNTVTKLNQFVSAGTDPDLIDSGLKDLVFHTLKATDGLDGLWTSSAKEVIERFYGSTNGVFRIYPGSPLMNTFDHKETDWYKRSVAFPNTTMYHRGKLSLINRNDVIIISRAVTGAVGMKRLQGVVGMTVSPKLLTSQLLNTVNACSDTDYGCHIVDISGNIIDSLGLGPGRHLSKTYPWIAAELVSSGKLKQQWCTGFSDGYHKVTLTLTGDMTFKNSDPCLQFWLRKVRDTNLFILIIGNREKLKCDESSQKGCTSCQPAIPNPLYQLSIPKCGYCNVNMTLPTCQCTCYCDTDLDECHGQFNTYLTNFPTVSCFYAPIYSTEFKPGSPGPMHKLDRCPIPCVAIEDLDVCNGLAHCKVSTDVYPTCIWKDEDELKNVNVSRFFPTTTPPRPPMSSSTDAPNSPGPVPHPSSPIAPISFPPQVTTRTSTKSSTQKATSPPLIPPATVGGGQSTVSLKIPSTTNTSTIAPVMTGSQVHSVTGSSSATGTSDSQSVTSGYQSVATQQTERSSGNGSNDNDDKKGLSGGAIAAIVIGLLALSAIGIFVGVKMYHKKFRRAGADESSKYRAGSSMFDSTVFLRGLDQVSINAAPPNSTDVPYQEMAN